MSPLTEALNSASPLEDAGDIESLVRTLREAVETAEEADASFPLLMVDALALALTLALVLIVAPR